MHLMGVAEAPIDIGPNDYALLLQWRKLALDQQDAVLTIIRALGENQEPAGAGSRAGAGEDETERHGLDNRSVF